jgi:hypothetical protein
MFRASVECDRGSQSLELAAFAVNALIVLVINRLTEGNPEEATYSDEACYATIDLLRGMKAQSTGFQMIVDLLESLMATTEPSGGGRAALSSKLDPATLIKSQCCLCFKSTPAHTCFQFGERNTLVQ